MKKYDVITFGSASEDIFVFSKDFFKKKLQFSLGDKVEIDQIIIRSGGGGTNAAATFASQGLKTAYCGSVGKDYAGFSILLDLKRFRISTEFLGSLPDKTTNHSVILSEKDKGKVILVYREASNYLPAKFDPKKLKADWFYFAPLAEEFARKTKKIIEFAHKQKIKIAFNPGKAQIEMLKKDKKILSKIDVLLMNERELKMLFGNRKIESIFKSLKPVFNGLISTGDKKGFVAFDGKYVYQGKSLIGKVTDKTGSGDAFGSGLVAGLIKTGNIANSLQLAEANAAACVREWGAKEGLLKEGQKYKKTKIKKYKLK